MQDKKKQVKEQNQFFSLKVQIKGGEVCQQERSQVYFIILHDSFSSMIKTPETFFFFKHPSQYFAIISVTYSILRKFYF